MIIVFILFCIHEFKPQGKDYYACDFISIS